MQRLKPQQHLQIVQIYFQNSHGAVFAKLTELHQVYGAHNCPSEQLMHNSMDRFLDLINFIDSKDLGLYPYKIQLVEELKPAGHQLRRVNG